MYNNIKKNSYLTIILYIILLVLFKYIINKSFFDIKILKETFSSHELTENFPIKNEYFESIKLIKNSNLTSYKLSDEINNDVYTKYKIITSSYPIRYETKSKFVISKIEEQIPYTCQLLESKKYLKLIKC
jgi:hypothetical protein